MRNALVVLVCFVLGMFLVPMADACPPQQPGAFSVIQQPQMVFAQPVVQHVQAVHQPQFVQQFVAPQPVVVRQKVVQRVIQPASVVQHVVQPLAVTACPNGACAVQAIAAPQRLRQRSVTVTRSR